MVSARTAVGGVCSALLLVLGCQAQTPHAIDAVSGFGAHPHEPAAGLDPEPFAYAVMSTDRTVSSIALLEPGGDVLRRDFVDSGSAPAGLVTALSGDVVVPTRSGDPFTLTLLDRFRSDVVTRIDVAQGKVLGQLRAEEREPGASAYSSNPQDLVILGPHEAWLSRYNPNSHVAASDRDAGNDLIGIRIDPEGLTRSDERIDLSPLDTTAQRVNPDSDEHEQVRAFARPSRMVRLGDKLVVGLSRISKSFDAVGDGAVALVDPAAGTAVEVPLSGLRNCSQVVPVPDDSTHVAVACTGPLAKGSGRAYAGLALLALDGDALNVEHVWHAEDDPDAAVTVFGLVSLGGTVVVAVAAGDQGSERPDALYRVDLADGSQRMLFASSQPWVLGDGAYNPRARRLFAPDASTDHDGRPTGGVHRFDVDDEREPEERDVVAVDDGLPPWQVAPL
jgi:hypothetical protein